MSNGANTSKVEVLKRASSVLFSCSTYSSAFKLIYASPLSVCTCTCEWGEGEEH